MLSRAENDRIIQTSAGTPCGELMRRYWQPVALSSELASGDPVPVDVLGEELVLFRDGEGHLGLIDRHCAHRGVDLSYGRCEAAGLRCLYHGWLFDVTGQCLDQPGEPAGSTYRDRVRLTGYPCREAGEMVFAYLGPDDPPSFPEFDWFKVPESQRLVGKVFQDCNYLQGNEGNLDQIHVSFLHRLPPVEENLGRVMAGSSKRDREMLAIDISPTIETERTSFGFRELVSRQVPDGIYFKTEAFVLPNVALFPGGSGGRNGYQGHWHVPIDDYTHWKFFIRFTENGPLDKETALRNYMGDELGANFRLKRNAGNRYRQDRAEVNRYPFVGGLGRNFPTHDTFATETMGPIQNRTKEHLGYGDKSIALMRRVMFDAIKELEAHGRAPAITGPAGEFDGLISLGHVVPTGTDVSAYLQSVLEDRKSTSGTR
jgi:phthalate 4,5-dioxygenase oxygenase subunit